MRRFVWDFEYLFLFILECRVIIPLVVAILLLVVFGIITSMLIFLYYSSKKNKDDCKIYFIYPKSTQYNYNLIVIWVCMSLFVDQEQNLFTDF